MVPIRGGQPWFGGAGHTHGLIDGDTTAILRGYARRKPPGRWVPERLAAIVAAPDAKRPSGGRSLARQTRPCSGVKESMAWRMSARLAARAVQQRKHQTLRIAGFGRLDG